MIGTSLTAIDVTGSILNAHPRATVIALSRHGDLPRRHEDPWRPRLPQPAFTVEEFLAFDSPLDAAVERIRSFGDDWRRAVDSLRPITQAAVDRDGRRPRRIVPAHYRHAWDDPSPPRGGGDRAGPRRLDRRRPFAVHGAVDPRVERDGGRRPRSSAGPITWDGGPDRGRRRARPRRHGQPAARGRDRGRLVAAGAAGDRDRRRSRDRPRARRERRARRCPPTRWARCARASCGRRIAIPEIRDQAADVARRLLGVPAST